MIFLSSTNITDNVKEKGFHEDFAEDEAVFDARKKFIVESYLVSLNFVINSTRKDFII